ncbi:hypothetical protein BU26DRAFT_169778 [Trematosphaeria pertusa]|uniref:Secreted protein n=1 Tax=Trematosphaeria pertusa TaxID=390896 RepID=A0A6A6HUA2_9PLEO|nr:uncharacterized protein BU26DRAFT_169778 [Trematosphaeria pertusa]KAF2241754.1 hypothetical protein BU26DRAFT_169778 [Trematosphaeria pertusa]
MIYSTIVVYLLLFFPPSARPSRARVSLLRLRGALLWSPWDALGLVPHAPAEDQLGHCGLLRGRKYARVIQLTHSVLQQFRYVSLRVASALAA